LTKQEKILKL